jgi:hypothetical protein
MTDVSEELTASIITLIVEAVSSSETSANIYHIHREISQKTAIFASEDVNFNNG